jgi:RNA polymerase sigma-70 factor (ECF subfamily)
MSESLALSNMSESLARSNGGARVTVPSARHDTYPVALERTGDLALLERLCRENWLPVYRCVSRWASSPADAEDLTQDAFLRAFSALDRVRGSDGAFRAYLLTIARNAAIDRWRAAGRVRQVPGRDLAGYADPALGPEATVVGQDQHQRLLAAIDRLPGRYSDVLRLRIVVGATAEEAGRRLGLTANAVRQLQYRALAALRRDLAQQIGEDDD